MNQRTPPFDNLKARQAVNYAINRQTLVNLRGGLGVPTENFLPPTYPQYKKIIPCVSVQPGEGEAARPAVRDDGHDRRRLHDLRRPSTKAQGEYLASQLDKIGWKTKLQNSPARTTSSSSETRRRRRRSASPTGSRTTPTRPTGSMSSRTAKRSPRRTTTTTRTSTSRTRTPRSTVSATYLRRNPSRLKNDERAGPRSTRSSWFSTQARLRS